MLAPIEHEGKLYCTLDYHEVSRFSSFTTNDLTDVCALATEILTSLLSLSYSHRGPVVHHPQ